MTGIKDTDRLMKIYELYMNGNSTLEIAKLYGVTHQAISEILRKSKLDTKCGGATKKSKTRIENQEISKVSKREKRSLDNYGATYSEVMKFSSKIRMAYRNQKRSAFFRGIEWKLTLPLWVKFWEDSGKFHMRGVGRGRYAMSRPGDAGPYAIGNILAITHEENSRENANKLVAEGKLGKGFPKKID